MRTIISIFKQTFWQGIGKVITSVSTFIVLGLVTRNYGEFGTGIFTLALTYLNIFYLLGDFGFNAHVLKELTNDTSKIKNSWGKLLGTRILWSVVLIVIAIIALPFLTFSNTDFSRAVLFGSLAILGSSVFVTSNLIFQSRFQYKLSVLSSSVGILIGLFFYFWLVKNEYPISALLISQSISWTIIAFISLALVRRFISTVMPTFDLSYIKKLFFDTWPIAATLALNVVYFRIDSFLLASFRGISDVGIYNVAYSVFQSALVIPTFIMNAYYPLMLKSLSKVKLVGFILLGIAILGILVSLIAAPIIINLLTGGAFEGSTQSLQILSLSFPAFFLSALFMWLLVAKGKYKQMLGIYLVGLLINLLLNIYFIPRFSYIGASWVTVVSEYIILVLQAVVLSRK